MAYEKTVWKNREVERPRTFDKIENPDGTITLVPAEGNIIEPGTPIIAANMNNIEEGIEEAHDLAQQAFQSASDGKTVIASSITAKGVPASNQDTFPTLANKIDAIETDPSIGTTDAVASDIIKGKKAVSQGNLLTGSLELTANALAAQVLAGITFYKDNPKQKLTGTMPNNSVFQRTINSQNGQINLPSGYIPPNSWVKAYFANLTPQNVRDKVNIGGVVGNLSPAIVDSIIFSRGVGYIDASTDSIPARNPYGFSTISSGSMAVTIGNTNTSISNINMIGVSSILFFGEVSSGLRDGIITIKVNGTTVGSAVAPSLGVDMFQVPISSYNGSGKLSVTATKANATQGNPGLQIQLIVLI